MTVIYTTYPLLANKGWTFSRRARLLIGISCVWLAQKQEAFLCLVTLERKPGEKKHIEMEGPVIALNKVN
jgi:hypothetical protein